MQNIERGQPKLWQKIAAGLTVAIIMFFIITSLFGSKSDKAGGGGLKGSEFETIINQKDITVKSLSIKHNEGKYDYWFDIRNNSTTTYNGQVHIALIDKNNKEIAIGDFASDKDIQSKMGDFVKVTAHTSPTQGIVGFRYWVKENDVLVKNGTGTLSNIQE